MAEQERALSMMLYSWPEYSEPAMPPVAILTACMELVCECREEGQ